jgi:hypothetical protein
MRSCVTIAVFAILVAGASHSDEADQYLSWNVELKDSTHELNSFIATQASEVIDRVNSNSADECSCEELTELIFRNIYLDRFRAPLLVYIETIDAIDVYPRRNVSSSDLFDLSIYRDVSFPSMIQVTRTVRVGDIYFGADKLAHFFGIGRRYYVRYQELRDEGKSRVAAEEAAIRFGILTENSILGKMINGIFSHADLEANYQGLLLAITFCEGEQPILNRASNGWILTRPIDIGDYVSPWFDESYNPPHYTGDVLDAVLPVLRKNYRDTVQLNRVRARFETYEHVKPNLSGKIIAAFFEQEKIPSQRNSILDALGLNESDPAAPIDSAALGGSASP